MMKSDPVITYNHMEEDDANQNIKKHLKKSYSVKFIYIAEALIIAALFLLMFFIF